MSDPALENTLLPPLPEQGTGQPQSRTPVVPGNENPRSDTADGALAATDPGAEVAAAVAARSRSVVFPVADWEKYEFLALLGTGGMGAVYKARDRQLDRTAALKFIRGDNPALVQRFLQEAHAQARLDHPNICRVYEVGQVAGKPYIAMEFVAGSSLEAARTRLSLHHKVQVIRDAALALHEAHRIGIIHRDIKPANIMIERLLDGTIRPVVMDFGLARDATENRALTQSGAVMGTPAYMPPEQARGNGRQLDRRADVYSLGATLYELLTGRPPFSGEDMVEVILEVLDKDPPAVRTLAPDVPADLETIVLKCLAKEPGQRYDSARALADDLQCYINGEPIQGRRSTLRYRLRRFTRRHRGLVFLSAIATLVTLTLVVLGVRTELRSQKRAQLAQQLGQDIKEMELFMRLGYALPLHDIGREQSVLRARMDALHTRLQTATKDTAAALHYALGRGHLVLREYADAQRELGAGWQGSYQPPEARTALGLALGERYRQELEKVQRSGDKKLIVARERELTEQFLNPALAYLQDAPQGVENPVFVQGLLALYRKQYDSALLLAQRAQTATPWLADPLVLEGDVYQAQGVASTNKGEYREGHALYLRAAACYQAAAAISRSDGAIHAAAARNWTRIMFSNSVLGTPVAEAAKAAEAAADQVMIANPRQSTGAELKSRLNGRLGQIQIEHGEDAKATLQTAVAMAEKAVRLNPEEWQTHFAYASSIGLLAELPNTADETVSALLQKSIAALKQTIQLNPNSFAVWHILGHKYQTLLEQQIIQQGSFSEDFFKAGESSFKKAVELDPNDFTPHMGLLDLYGDKVFYSYHHGQPIDKEIALAAEEEKIALRLNKNYYYVHYISFTILMAKAEWLAWTGAAPDELMAQIEQKLAQIEVLKPGANTSLGSDAIFHYTRAINELNAGRDPQPAIAAGLTAVGKSQKQFPKAAALAIIESALRVMAGRVAGSTPQGEAELRQAVAAAQRAVTELPVAIDSHSRLCEALRYAVAERAGRPKLTPAQAQETTQWLVWGIKECDTTLARNPTLAVAHANRGALLLVQAGREATPAARQSTAAAAHAALEKALQINQWRRREWAPLLTVAQTLAAAAH